MCCCCLRSINRRNVIKDDDHLSIAHNEDGGNDEDCSLMSFDMNNRDASLLEFDKVSKKKIYHQASLFIYLFTQHSIIDVPSD